MLRVGLIGIGFMGWIHYLAYQRSSAAKLAAIATRDAKKKAGDWTSIKGNFGPPGAVVDLSSVEKFDDWRDMIQSPNIDAVDICLPPAMHAEVSIAALEAGKHVLCEKPIALNAADARAMTEAAKANQRVLNIAHVLPFMGAFKYALELCKSGQFGNVRSVVLKRIISDPTWIPDFYNPKTVGGPMVDLHIHDAHFIQLLCGKPKSVTAGGWTRGDVVEYAQMLYRFEQSGVVASASSGVCTSSARMFTHGFEIQFERAAMCYEFAAHSNGSSTFGTLLYGENGKTEEISLPQQDEIDAFVGEIDTFASATQSQSTVDSPLSAELAMKAVEICEAVEESVRTGDTIVL